MMVWIMRLRGSDKYGHGIINEKQVGGVYASIGHRYYLTVKSKGESLKIRGSKLNINFFNEF